jgi:hypothetical protein
VGPEVEFDARGVEQPEQRVNDADTTERNEPDHASGDQPDEREDRFRELPEQRPVRTCTVVAAFHCRSYLL